MKSPLPAAALLELRQQLGEDAVLTDPADCLAYGYDNSRRMAQPDAVVFASTHEQVAAVVRVCLLHSIPLTARGRGTNTTGASVPIAGGIVLSLERMNRILRISAGDRLLVCEAGALNADVQAAAAEHGLFWAPDPTSAAFSSVGGNLACGAGGPRAVKYGTARDAVLGLKAVAGNGSTLVTGAATTKSVVGYDLTRLLIGSEGTLAIITEATLKLLPKPKYRRLLRAAYSSVHAAADAVARLMNQAHTPSALEFMDGHAVRLAEQYRPTGIPPNTQALLLIEADGDADSLPAAVSAMELAASGEGLVELKSAQNSTEAETLWACRKALSPSLRQLAPKKVNEDVAVPVTCLAELMDGIEKLAAKHALLIVCFGHAGNGNVHVNILANPDDPAVAARIEPCLRDVFRLVLSLQGTISGEHGVGIDKRDYVAWEIPAETLAFMHAIKRQFDPSGILNPGKAIPGPD
ncbi:MAG: FAD-linked oxidase C-terminal domain-containing protein [Pseudomonadota bacterium]